MCELPRKCPDQCKCLMYASSCQGRIYNHDLFKLAEYFAFIKLVNVTTSVVLDHFLPDRCHNLFIFYWRNSLLEHVCFAEISCLKQVQILDYSFNSLPEIKKFCFYGISEIKVLLLDHNKISFLEGDAFASSAIHFSLDLSHNKITELASDMFGMSNIFVLNISNSSFAKIDEQLKIVASIISTDDYRVCCLINNVCSAQPKWPQSCSILPKNTVLKSVFLFVICTILLLNLLAVFKSTCDMKHSKHKKVEKKKRTAVKERQAKAKAFVMIVGLINCNDFCFGIYFLLISAADKYYGDTFAAHVEWWKRSLHCKSISFVSLFQHLNSLLFLSFLALSRFLVVVCPFQRSIRRTRNVAKYLLTGISFNCCVILIFVITYSEEQQSVISSPMCILFADIGLSQETRYVTLSIATLQLSTLTMIAAVYGAICLKLDRPSKALRAHVNTNVQSNRSVLINSLVTVGSNALCWIPSSVFYVFSIASEKFSPDLIIWNALLVNSINTLMNPIILSLYPFIKYVIETQRNDQGK